MFKKIKLFLTLGFIFLLISFFVFPQTASADALSALSDTMSRLSDSTPTAVYSDHTIKYITPSGVGAGETMEITFPAGFGIGSVDYTDIDVSWGASTGYENELTLAGTPSGSTWGAAFTGQVLAITSGTGTISTTSKVVIEIGQNATGGGANAQIQNHATAATYTISIGGDFGDTGKIAIVILSNDQVIVDTTIDPYLTFTISDNAVSLLKSGGLNPDYNNTGFNSDSAFSVNTNAVSGYNISYKGATLSANGGANTIKYGADTTTTLASAGEATASNTFTVTYIVNVTETTEAGAYSTTITYICTGNF